MKDQDQNDLQLEALKVREQNNLGTVDLTQNRPSVDDRVKITVGQHIIEKSELAYDGSFYPEGTMIKYRAATGAEIRHFSMVNEASPVAVDDAMKQMINACVTIYNGKGNKLSYTNIYSMDRFILALKIREATYPNPASKLTYDAECSCEIPLKIELATDKLVYSEFNDAQAKYFDKTTGSFLVTTKSYGIVKVDPLTIYREQLYKDYIISKVEKNSKIDTLFGELYWLFINNDNQYDKDILNTIYDAYQSLPKEKLAFYIELNKKLSMVPVSQVKDTCTCGLEVRKDITFPSGVKHFYIDTATVDSEFC